MVRLESIHHILVLTATYTRKITLLNQVTYLCLLTCRLIFTIVKSLTLFWRTKFQLLTRLTTPNASFFSYKTLTRIVLTTHKTSWVGFGDLNTSLSLRVWCLYDPFRTWNMEHKLMKVLELKTSFKTTSNFIQRW